MHSLDREAMNCIASSLNVQLPQVPVVSRCDGEYGFVTPRLNYRCEGLIVMNPLALPKASQSLSAGRRASDQYPHLVSYHSNVVDIDYGWGRC